MLALTIIFPYERYTATDIKQFMSSLGVDSQCVMEATGICHLRLAHAQYEAGIGLSVVKCRHIWA